MISLPKQYEWLRKKSTDELTKFREETAKKMANLGAVHREGFGLYTIMGNQLKAIDFIINERI